MAALKIMSPISLSQLTISEVDVDCMAVEVEPSHQYSITCCCHMTDSSWGTVWQNGGWHESMDEAKVCHWIPPCGKKWHPLTFTDACETFVETKQWVWAQWGSGWCVSEVATTTWKTSHVAYKHAQLSHHKIKSVSISSSTQIGWWWWLC